LKSGLILVDIQNDYFKGGRMELVGMEEAGIKANKLLTFFRDNRKPTFHIQHIAAAEGATFFLPDTKGVEIHDSVKPQSDDLIIQKRYPNSFRDTPLLNQLKNAGVADVVICGAMSHMCIDATTRAAADLGFKCTLIHDGCATRNLEFSGKKVLADEVHASFMAALGAAYARVISCGDFIADIKNDE
jgi:nicotinamidase-related amidase